MATAAATDWNSGTPVGGAQGSWCTSAHADHPGVLDDTGVVWFVRQNSSACFYGLPMKHQMKSIFKIFLGMGVIFRDESNEGN